MGLQHSDPYVLRKTLCHIVDAATTFHLELFQIVAPFYVSGISTQRYPERCQACIDVTLYVELFITSITEKHFLIPLRIIFDCYLVIHS